MVCAFESTGLVTSPVNANGNAVNTSTFPVAAVALPRMESVVIVAMSAKLTTLAAIAVTFESAARVTSPVNANGNAVKTSGTPVAAVARPMIESVAIFAILASVTVPAPIVVPSDPAVVVTSPVSAGKFAAGSAVKP